MATTCAKDGTVEETEQIMKSAAEYQERVTQFADNVIKDCISGEVTEQQAKESLAGKFVSDPRGFRNSIEKLERALMVQQGIDPKPVSGTEIREVTKSESEGYEQDPERDKFGRPDYIRDEDKQPSTIEGFERGIRRDTNKILQDENDTIVQSTHIHRHKNGVTISTLYRDGRRENYEITHGDQQVDVKYTIVEN